MYTTYDFKEIKNVGFVSTRFQGTDGVSLETEKWARVLTQMGYECFYYAGLSDWEKSRTVVDPLAYFDHPKVRRVQAACFGVKIRDAKTARSIHHIRRQLKISLMGFIEKFKLDLLIIENALAIPMHIPLGLAITEVIAETGINTIGHHHDFFWERQRFLVNCVSDYLSMAFPPNLPTMQHIVINSEARSQLSFRTGISSTIVANVFDYDTPPPEVDAYSNDVRSALGLKEDDIFILQPTRIIARKGIESAIELVSRMHTKKAKLFISHPEKDEGKEYFNRVIDYAKRMKVDLIMRPDLIGGRRSTDADGKKIYSLWDIYPHADFITYPSTHEGFGNAFLEAIYFKKPLLVNRYSIYQTDIEPVGFKAVVMDAYITEENVREVNRVLKNKALRDEWAQTNYELARRFFSYTMLRQKLTIILVNFGQGPNVGAEKEDAFIEE